MLVCCLSEMCNLSLQGHLGSAPGSTSVVIIYCVCECARMHACSDQENKALHREQLCWCWLGHIPTAIGVQCFLLTEKWSITSDLIFFKHTRGNSYCSRQIGLYLCFFFSVNHALLSLSLSGGSESAISDVSQTRGRHLFEKCVHVCVVM